MNIVEIEKLKRVVSQLPVEGDHIQCAFLHNSGNNYYMACAHDSG